MRSRSVLGNRVGDRRVARPDADRVRVAARFAGGLADRFDGAHDRLVGEERVEHDHVVGATREGERVRTERDEPERDRLVEAAIEVQDGEAAGRSVVPEDDLALPEPPHQTGEVLHLRRRDLGKSVRAEQRVDPATEAECEPAAAEPVHGRRVRAGDQRMTGVVVRRRSGDAEPSTRGRGRPGERDRLLDVEPLGQEDGSEAEAFAVRQLVEEVGGRLGRSSEPVEAELVDVRTLRIFCGCQHGEKLWRYRPTIQTSSSQRSTECPSSPPAPNGSRARSQWSREAGPGSDAPPHAGIRVNAVAPGLVRTGLTEGAFMLPGIVEGYEENTPLRRHATPEEISNLVAFLASDEAAFITGSLHLVDGGAHTMRYPDLLGILEGTGA